MYLCTPNTAEDCSNILSRTERHDIEFANNLRQIAGTGNDSVAVVHMDLDGGEEPAVTTDVMFSGMRLENLLASALLLYRTRLLLTSR